MNDFFLSCKESRMDQPRSFYGSFYLGPFSGSQSLTVANALRRTLLSELTGIAITSVSIQGAKHEFSTLPGIRESVLDLVLNLKEIVLKSSHNLTKTQIGYLYAYGPGVVRACDLKLPAGIQCVDPDQYIATLSQDGILVMKFTINEGKNYIVQKRMKSDSHLLNSKWYKDNSPLFLDAIFMPVTKVNYLIESYFRHSDSTINQKKRTNSYLENDENLQVIMLEIWTNGSVHPRKALYQGLNHLMNLFSQLEKMKIFNAILNQSITASNTSYEKVFKNVEYEYEYYSQLEQAWKTSNARDDLSSETILAYQKKYRKELLAKSDLRSILVANLNISNRSRRLLEQSNIWNLADLIARSPKKLRDIRGFGDKCFEEVKEAVEKIGLEFSDH